MTTCSRYRLRERSLSRSQSGSLSVASPQPEQTDGNTVQASERSASVNEAMGQEAEYEQLLADHENVVYGLLEYGKGSSMLV